MISWPKPRQVSETKLIHTELLDIMEKTGKKVADGEDHTSRGGSNSSIVARGGYSGIDHGIPHDGSSVSSSEYQGV